MAPAGLPPEDLAVSRYSIIGPRMNPVSAMSYKIWDYQAQDYLKHTERNTDWEFLHKENAEQVIRSLELKWHTRFLTLAQLVSTWSKDPSTKCGAVIVRPDKTICSVGFNGFPKECNDDKSLYDDREVKLARVIHAEVNAILHSRESLQGYTMYTVPSGISPTCDRCATNVIQVGIKKVIHVKQITEFSDRWKEAAARALLMYEEAGVEVVHLDG